MTRREFLIGATAAGLRTGMRATFDPKTRQVLAGGVKLVAQGFAAIPAAHACYTARDLFSGIELVDPPSGWAALFADDAKRWKFADVVYNAWSLYDWPDLVAQNETTSFAAAESVWPAGLEKEMNTSSSAPRSARATPRS